MSTSPRGITIVGLGPGDPGARTVAAQVALAAASRIILRTAIHPGLDDLVADPRVTTCDDLYEVKGSFGDLYPAIVERILDAAEESDVVYAVPGHPSFGERTVPLLRERAAASGIEVLTTPAVSAFDAIALRLEQDPLTSELQLIDAPRLADILDEDPFAAGKLGIDPYRPVLIGQVYSRDLAIAVKLALQRLYPEDHLIMVITAAGVVGGERVETVPLHALDRLEVDHLSSVWVPPVPALAGFRAEATVMRVIALLRAPGGCPWDRKQTHQSLRDAVLNEAYEAVDAIDNQDLDNLEEELGDLLLLIALHSQIATENGHFTIEDVYEGLSRKLIRRHPHVFGDVDAQTPADVIRTWNNVKREERGGRPPKPLFEKLPKSMPAMQRAVRLLGDAPPAPGEHLPESTPGQQLLAAIWHMVSADMDPEQALSQALAAQFGEPSDPEGERDR